MRIRVSTILVTALLCLAPMAAWADLAPYGQDFEGLLESDLDQPDQLALQSDGWLGFVNVFDGGGGFLYNYGFPAPNGGFGGPAISAVVVGEGGPTQGFQQLSVFSDYNNGDHGNGFLIETNVFQERIVGAADVGTTWLFEFDAKRGNIDGATTAMAFIKTLDPNAGYALTNFPTVDMTGISETWNRYLIAIFIDPSLEGQIFQFGFLNTATNFDGSGIFYDNVRFVSLDDQCPGDDDEDGEGVEICHVPPGNPGNAHTIFVGEAAVPSHMAHGDTMGACAAGDGFNMIDVLTGQPGGGLADVFASPDGQDTPPLSTDPTSNRTRRERSRR